MIKIKIIRQSRIIVTNRAIYLLPSIPLIWICSRNPNLVFCGCQGDLELKAKFRLCLCFLRFATLILSNGKEKTINFSGLDSEELSIILELIILWKWNKVFTLHR